MGETDTLEQNCSFLCASMDVIKIFELQKLSNHCIPPENFKKALKYSLLSKSGIDGSLSICCPSIAQSIYTCLSSTGNINSSTGAVVLEGSSSSSTRFNNVYQTICGLKQLFALDHEMTQKIEFWRKVRCTLLSNNSKWSIQRQTCSICWLQCYSRNTFEQLT